MIILHLTNNFLIIFNYLVIINTLIYFFIILSLKILNNISFAFMLIQRIYFKKLLLSQNSIF